VTENPPFAAYFLVLRKANLITGVLISP